MSAGFMFLALKKRITDHISHAAGFSIFVNTLKTHRTMRKRGSIVCKLRSKKTNKLYTHAHHSDRSVAAAIFANGIYFVDTLCLCGRGVALYWGSYNISLCKRCLPVSEQTEGTVAYPNILVYIYY
jgi:hypothetical protein